MSEFEGLAEFDEGLIEQDLYPEERKNFPGATWLAKASQDRSPGHWVMDVESIEHLGAPEPFWQQQDVRFGEDPNAEPVLSWVTRRFRCCPIGVRQCAIVTDDLGKTHRYPPFTKKENRVKGRYQSHIQVMVMVPGLNAPIVVGLKGLTKTVSWDNDPTSGYSVNGFYKGAWQGILEYTERASKQRKVTFPALCMWWVDLVPAYNENGTPQFVKVGSSSTVYVNPFNVDLRTGDDDKLPSTRFVGGEKFIAFQAIRKEVVVPWEELWKDPEALAAEAAQESANGDYSDDAEETYDDDLDSIPF